MIVSILTVDMTICMLTVYMTTDMLTLDKTLDLPTIAMATTINVTINILTVDMIKG